MQLYFMKLENKFTECSRKRPNHINSPPHTCIYQTNILIIGSTCFLGLKCRLGSTCFRYDDLLVFIPVCSSINERLNHLHYKRMISILTLFQFPAMLGVSDVWNTKQWRHNTRNFINKFIKNVHSTAVKSFIPDTIHVCTTTKKVPPPRTWLSNVLTLPVSKKRHALYILCILSFVHWILTGVCMRCYFVYGFTSAWCIMGTQCGGKTGIRNPRCFSNFRRKVKQCVEYKRLQCSECSV